MNKSESPKMLGFNMFKKVFLKKLICLKKMDYKISIRSYSHDKTKQ